MTFTRSRRILGILILLVSLALLCWGAWPIARLAQSLLFKPAEMQLPTPESLLPLILFLT